MKTHGILVLGNMSNVNALLLHRMKLELNLLLSLQTGRQTEDKEATSVNDRMNLADAAKRNGFTLQLSQIFIAFLK